MGTHKSGQEYIKDELEKTGYPLELEIHSLINSHKNWIAFAQDYFFDEDERKGRSIDISAFEMPIFGDHLKIIKKPIDPLDIRFNLAIECKKSKNNWVFFPIERIYPGFNGQCISFLEDINGLSLLNAEILRPNHFDPIENKISPNYTIFPIGRKNEIFEAIMQLVKYITYSKYNTIKRLAKVEVSKYRISFWFPIIVFDGKMWNVSFEEGNVKNVIESKHIILKNTYRPIQSMEEANFLIDIVHRSYFKDFLGIIKKDIDDLINNLIKDSNKRLNYIIENFKWDSRGPSNQLRP